MVLPVAEPHCTDTVAVFERNPELTPSISLTAVEFELEAGYSLAILAYGAICVAFHPRSNYITLTCWFGLSYRLWLVESHIALFISLLSMDIRMTKVPGRLKMIPYALFENLCFWKATFSLAIPQQHILHLC